MMMRDAAVSVCTGTLGDKNRKADELKNKKKMKKK
jgi:hypothetical protein